MVYQLCIFSNCNVFRILQRDLSLAHPDCHSLSYYPSAACTALWLPVNFRICYKIAVIYFKAIHNLGPAYLSILINIKRCCNLAITCGLMWTLFCMTLPLAQFKRSLGDRQEPYWLLHCFFVCLELLASFLPSYLYSLFFSDYSSCGVSPVDFRSRIVGGKNSKRGWWPWHVGIYNTRGRGNGLSKTIWSFPLSITETCFIGRSEVVRETKQNFVSSKQ